MALAIVRSCTVDGIAPRPVAVEVHVGGGLPAMSIVGLPDSAVREARDRVKAALSHLGFGVPQVRVTVNLAPADVRKDGGRFDLPIALGLLLATRQLPADVLDDVVVVGELGLGGALRPVSGVLPVALSLRIGNSRLLLPEGNLAEAALSADTRLLSARTLGDACEALRARDPGRTGREVSTSSVRIGPDAAASARDSTPDMRDVIGQGAARRAVEVAAAGGHALLLHGPPGTGKSMLARRLPGLCAPLAEHEALELASLRSVAGEPIDAGTRLLRPFRSPHHTASAAALVGGGVMVRPGEISLAHHGVLFLDELAEFPRRVLDALRQPLESGCITVSRAGRRADYPAEFQLIAAMNPCPCGHHGEPGRCRCGIDIVRRYRARVSGPLLDRFDLVVGLRYCEPDADSVAEPEASVTIARRVAAAASRQRLRQGGSNARLPPGALGAADLADAGTVALFDAAVQRLRLSRRGRDKVLRVARTIADLGGHVGVPQAALAEALGYRAAGDADSSFD